MPPSIRRLARQALAEADLIRVPFRHLGEGIASALTRRPRRTDRDVALSRISAAEVVSFDVYDTLVERRLLLPTDIHLLVGATAVEQSLVARPADWADARMRAENVARAEAAGPDVRLDEIYAQLRGLFADPALERVHEAELDAEVRLTRPTHRGRILWDAAQAAGATILVTSDIYLPKDAVAAILTDAGYTGWERLYVSGDDGIAKFDGSVFHLIKREFPGRRVLHIGDNPHSDARAARRAGVAALQVRRPFDAHVAAASALPRHVDPRSRRRHVGARTTESSLVGALVERRIDTRDASPDPLDEIGYAVLGPALVGFAQYLHREAASRGVRRLLFLAREGRILQDAYLSYFGDDARDAEYAVLSTRMLGLAELTDPLSPQSLRFLTKTSAPVTAVDYVRRVLPDLEPVQVRAACARIGVDASKRLTFGDARARLPRLFEAFGPELAARGAAARPLLQEYLKQRGFGDRHTALVDSGWAGTIQDSLTRLTGAEQLGFYVGLSDTALTRSMPGLSALLDERRGGRVAVDFRRVYRRTPALEILLAYPDAGSAAELVPTADGSLDVSYLPNEFLPEDRSTIRTIQTAALDFVREYAETARTLPSAELSREFALGPLLEFLATPSVAQLRALSGVRFDGSYGVRPARLGAWWIPTALRRR
jgi:FMN phosphatase YigB (HAD superfamily)